MRYIIDIEKGTCVPESPTNEPNKPVVSDFGSRLVEAMKPHIGAQEYTGIVADIQKWYYGSMVKASWCATTVSYFLSKLGRPIKEENVYRLMIALNEKPEWGTMYYRNQMTNLKIAPGDILFWNWDAPKAMLTTSSKHVNVAYDEPAPSYQSINCIGGNQDDQLKVNKYNIGESLWAVFKWR